MSQSVEPQKLLDAQTRILQQSATTQGLNELLRIVCLEVAALLGDGAIASVLLLDDSSLTHGAAPGLSPAYLAAIDGVTIGPHVGSCGSAAFRAENVIVSDIASDPLWLEYKALAAQFGLKACWSIPIFSTTDTVCGTLAIYYQAQKSPADFELDIIDRFAGLVGLIIDRARTERELKARAGQLFESETKYRNLFERSKDAILIIENQQFVDCNAATVNMLGYRDKQQLLQTHPSQLSPPLQPDGRSSAEKADEMMAIAIEHGSHRFEWDHIRADGSIFPVEVSLTAIRDERGKQIIHTVWRDITLQKQQQERILHQAHYDGLTGLPNRFLALDRLSQLIKESHRRNSKIAVLFLDLDDFKKINDTLGHEAGDRLLVMAAQRLQKSVRKGDTVARLGGDEFIMVLGGLTKPADAHPVASCLLERFRDSFALDGRELILTASLGIACYPDDGDTAGELLRKADMAMYHSKEQGRNSYHFFTSAMNDDVSRRLLLEEQLHGALERKEFSLVYQPLISVSERRIVGAEVLLRWYNPTLGQVPPDEFIPISEQTGHILPIGEYVLSAALTMAAAVQQRCGPSFKMAVNLSPRQFRDPNLVSSITTFLSDNGLAGETLELEITEGVLLSGLALVGEALSALNDLGISLAMDDFGTGYSSLSYLRQYPFDTLKIDRSFVQDITLDPADRELVSATIAMAHGLGLSVVAEGVETEEQLTHLVQQRCDYAQGYLFSKPVPPADFMRLLERGVQ